MALRVEYCYVQCGVQDRIGAGGSIVLYPIDYWSVQEKLVKLECRRLESLAIEKEMILLFLRR